MSALPIRLRGISKTFGRRNRAVRALDDVTLEIPGGRITGLLGANGAGKATLIHVMVGLVHSDAGSCEIFGLPPTHPRARTGVGFLPEEVSYEAGFRLGEIARVHARLAGATGADPLSEILVRTGLRLPLSRRIAQCSLGTARRLALACALAGRPRLLLLDEPTSGLDVGARDSLLVELVRFRRRGGTVLVSSHVLSELQSICDGFVILKRGRVVRSGELGRGDFLEELYRSEMRR
jgi:ABC-2 type transport system ATP-binding protein